jgi:hypothetical protein
MKNLFLFLILLLLTNCHLDVKEALHSSQRTIGAKEASISESNEKLILRFEIDDRISISDYEYLSSIALISFCDSTDPKTINNLDSLEIEIIHLKSLHRYRYSIKEIPSFKKSMLQAATFIAHFLSSKNELNEPLVNAQKIAYNDLLDLNEINNQIQVKNRVANYSFDGFKIKKEQGQTIMNIKISLFSANNNSYFGSAIIQLTSEDQKIFYFELN